jgi:hypothetical protein
MDTKVVVAIAAAIALAVIAYTALTPAPELAKDAAPTPAPTPPAPTPPAPTPPQP